MGADLSPDGSRVCWTSKELGHWDSDIVVVRTDGSGRVRTLREPGRDDGCQWIDDDHVLFKSWRSGHSDFFVWSLRGFGRDENLTLWDDGVDAPFLGGG